MIITGKCGGLKVALCHLTYCVINVRAEKNQSVKIKINLLMNTLYINIMKMTFELNFNLYQAFKQYEYTKIRKETEAVN